MEKEMVVYIGKKEMWSIYDGRYRASEEIPGTEMKEAPFAVCIQDKTGITRITDVMISDADIEAAAGIPAFGERCRFRHKADIFDGTFTDALRYIKKRF